jgi:RecA-family ATPase
MPSPIRVFQLDEFLRLQIPVRKAIADPLIHEQSIVMIHSWRGVGKSLLAMSLAYHIAAGEDFLGWTIERPRPVLYVDGELPAKTVQDRFQVIHRSNPGRDRFNHANLRILTPDFVDGPMPNLATEDGQALFDRSVVDAEVIIIDSITTLAAGGGDGENSAESWLLPQAWALRHRKQGRAIVFLHHDGKGGKQRGSSKREDVMDTVVKLAHPSDYRMEEGARFELRYEKTRNFTGHGSPPQDLVVQAQETSGLRIKWAVTALDTSNYDKVVELANTGMKQADIARELGIDRSNVSRHHKRGVIDGKIAPRKKGES